MMNECVRLFIGKDAGILTKYVENFFDGNYTNMIMDAMKIAIPVWEKRVFGGDPLDPMNPVNREAY
jgi:hypothetical protein